MTTQYAEIATERAIDRTLTYHVPPDLHGKLVPGHLVRLDLRTAAEPGIVVHLHTTQPVYADGNLIVTKPVIETLAPDPVVTPFQIAVSQWISQRYLSPLGPCLWLWLPPGLVGKRDVVVHLRDADADAGVLPRLDDADDLKLLDTLKRRGALTGTQLSRVMRANTWQTALRHLEKAGVVRTESILAPPRVKPRKVQVASLAIDPDHIPYVKRHLGKSNRMADLLTIIARLEDEEDAPPYIGEVLAVPGIGQGTLDKLLAAGYADIYDEDFLYPTEDLDTALFELRGGHTDLHVLQVLAREDKPTDVSWLYAQTDAKLADLKRLETYGFIHLGEQQTIRDSLADRDFVPSTPPRLTPGQRAVWGVVRGLLAVDPHPASPVDGGGAPLSESGHVSSSVDHEVTSDDTTIISDADTSPSLSTGRGTQGVGSETGHTTLLLHGVTGSGKTEIYLRAIQRVIEQGRQALFLVPEIALTAQTVRRVAARFPGQTAIVHSHLSDGERYDTWHRARDGEVSVVVGARSALFTPLPDVGLIILDEEHDGSYKQTPPVVQPYYHTRNVAEHMMRANDGLLILGSATPSVETMFRAQRGDIAYAHLPDRIMGHRVRVEAQSRRIGVKPRYTVEPSDSSDAVTIPLPPVDVVDMRAELHQGNTGMFSDALQDALRGTLARGEQAILFLNRRGASTYVFCRDCGYVATCKNCDMPMTYHAQDGRLHCHHCANVAANPTACPNCHSRRIKYFGAGTQHVEDAFNAHFPDAVALRWDGDTAAERGAHDLILTRFMQGQADVLIGTQMIAKGLDLPLVTLVGVVSADVGLNLPDFRAAEKTFQLLTQVAGRAGRGLLGGKVILQTYQPDNYAVAAASQHDYDGFYAQEIAYRREMGYPPYRRMARILFTDPVEQKARHAADGAASRLHERLNRGHYGDTALIGPTPCFFGRINRLYRWQILLRGPDPSPVLAGLDFGPRAYVDVDPVDVL